MNSTLNVHASFATKCDSNECHSNLAVMLIFRSGDLIDCNLVSKFITATCHQREHQNRNEISQKVISSCWVVCYNLWFQGFETKMKEPEGLICWKPWLKGPYTRALPTCSFFEKERTTSQWSFHKHAIGTNYLKRG
jgi:hypothetical protein